METKAGGPVRPGGRVYYGWWVLVALSSLIFLNSGTYYYAFSAFFNPIKSSLALSATAVSAAFAMRSLEGGLMAPVSGFLVDRMGPRKMVIIGAFTSGFGMLWLSRAHSLLTFYVPFLVIALGTSFCAGMVGMATTANWFVRKRGMALGLYSTGAGLGGFLVPIVVWLINHYDWRMALVVTGLAFWVVGAIAALVVRQKPEDMGLLPDGDTPRQARAHEEARKGTEVNLGLGQALKTRSFWFLALAFMLGSMAPQAVAALQIPYLESRQISTALAGLVVSAVAVVSILGRLGFGWLGDYMEKRYVVVAALGLQTVGLVVLSALFAPWMLILYLVTYSPAFGGTIPLRPAILADYYGRKAIGSVQGVLAGIMTLGGIGSPIFAAWVFDSVGSYRPAFYTLAAVTAMGIPLVLLAKRPVAAG